MIGKIKVTTEIARSKEYLTWQRQVAWHLTPSSSSNELGDRSHNLSSVLVHFADQIMSVINIFF